ncbi:glycosyltransferase family 2 protein [Pedobacter montanisoli]|uniref:Glycosyltransferase n=1 Tax=Pedobacter montanisoli TaxID=2923277 RepID=A0ABS9ZVV0_9SPHI|nr:glycosyltransferase family 2 protein [Pedobacter montanisoli]MCJ0742438.1 glycosyltransferase [Pedobacter montanisoli]
MYSIIIATCNRRNSLLKVIDCLNKQSFKPEKLIIVDSSEENQDYLSDDISIIYRHVRYKSAAKQRNEGAQLCNSDYIVFLDDDVEFERDFFERIFNLVKAKNILIAGPRQIGAEIKKPGLLLKGYYRLQAGYKDETYGGKVFGAGINCYPCYEHQHDELLEVSWLPSTCLVIKNSIFNEVKFPDFEGYSYAEDVFLTASLAKKYPVYILRNISYLHHSITTNFKENILALNKMKLKNQKIIAEQIVGLKGIKLQSKVLLHKLFLSLAYLKNKKNSFLHIRSIWQ